MKPSNNEEFLNSPLAVGEIPLERNPRLSIVIKDGKAYIRTRDTGKVDVGTRIIVDGKACIRTESTYDPNKQ